MINRNVPPAIYDAVSFDIALQSCNVHHCDNNIPIYWLSAGAQEVTELTLVFEAGIWHEPQTGVAQAVAALLKSGTPGKTAFELSEAIEYYGASLKVSANNDWAFVSLLCLTKHLPALLPTLREIILEATFPEAELDIYKQNALQRLAVNLRQSDFMANRNIDAMLFGKAHPYGRYTEPADVEALNVGLLRKFHNERYSAQNCKIFVAGNFSEADMLGIAQTFGTDNWHLSSETPHKEAANLEPAAQKLLQLSNDPNGVQGAIRIARPVPMRQDPVFPELFVMNTVFGGYFGSRLMANIREDKGYTYGIYSSLFSYRHAAVMLIGTEAGKEVCEQTVAEVIKEMRLMQQTLVPEDELMLVKNYLLGSIIADLDGPFSIMQRWKNLILNQQSIEDFYRNINVYKNISAERIQELAQAYLREEDFYQLVVI